jgi:hypothetical protein
MIRKNVLHRVLIDNRLSSYKEISNICINDVISKKIIGYWLDNEHKKRWAVSSSS